ncbi:McrC family protein [Caviibacterium pharyngocola]|uniref:Restriction endonuclease n=1 Tax=Caviibacterium pharyngocola TaxID=28159 RepID=A0A2M8RXE7_9PAST|nr:hypothetical protein [Caviibacterium pharyngocola]PJG83562.1 hypothetical protein CVP04_02690 [Caviibacterium pharyngocola]
MMLITTDNNQGNLICEERYYAALQRLTLPIEQLIENNPNLLIFPEVLNRHNDDIHQQIIFDLAHQSSHYKLTTYNVMGFIGVNQSLLSIHSRFTPSDQEDYFLHYMLQKVFCINMLDLKFDSNKENIFDFLLYLFPAMLIKALKQGLFKQYQYRNYNNNQLKGKIDLSTHIKRNIPFQGKIAYSLKEYCYDNNVTQLIRHTIEQIKRQAIGRQLLTANREIIEAVRKIESVTPTYCKNEKRSVLNKNNQPISHTYFSDYVPLQKLCKQILNYEEIKYGKEKDKIYGILFDGAWLWEEYLNTLLQSLGFNHPKNKTGKNALYLFEHSKNYKRFPDFWYKNIILDAKYKRLERQNEIHREDIHQLISYMYIQKADIGAVIYPTKTDSECFSQGKLNGYGGNIFKIAFSIPQNASDYFTFVEKIKESERFLQNSVRSYIQAD